MKLPVITRFMLSNRLGIFGGVFALFVLMAHAEAPSAPAQQALFTALSWDLVIPDGGLSLNVRVKNKERSVVLFGRERSAPQLCDGRSELVFTKTISRDGKSIEAPVAKAVIPNGMTRVLLIFRVNPSRSPSDLPYLVTSIDDSYSVFPGQTVRFMNCSTQALGGMIGIKTFTVEPGADQVVPVSLPEPDHLLPLKLAGRDANGVWRKLRSTGLPMSPGQRALVFMIDDPARPGRANLLLLSDQVEPPATPPLAGRG